MTHTHATQRRSEQGFTLVELAIVMVIIGLLIGGILKGQELIANAKISATVSQLKGLDAALNTFQDKYSALPGDMLTPSTRLPGCTAIPCSTTGDGNGRIGTNLTTVPAVGNEHGTAFAHLSGADLISGIITSPASATFGNLLPAVKAGGGMWIGYGAAAPATTTITVGRHYAVLTGQVAAPTATTGVLSSSDAAQLDRKLDDGVPASGGLQTLGTGCVSGTAYDEANTAATCSILFRVLN